MSATPRKLFIVIAVAAASLIEGTLPSGAIGRFSTGETVVKLAPGTVQALEVAPTGQGASEEQCKRYEVAINSWREEVLDRMLAGDNKGAAKAERNQKGLQNEATDAGCFIIY